MNNSHRCLLCSSAVLLVVVAAASLVSADGCTLPSQRVDCGDLTCNETTKQCMPCTESSQCWDKALVCIPDRDDHIKKCLLQDVGGLVTEGGGALGLVASSLITIVICAIAVIGGVGGGGVLSPLYSVLIGLPLVDAVAMSQAAIVGQSAFNMFLLMRRFHPAYQPPKPTRPVINYPLVCYWLPISLIGTMWGNLIGTMVPDWFRMALLLVIISYALKRVVDRMIETKRKNEEAAAGALETHSSSASDLRHLNVASRTAITSADDINDSTRLIKTNNRDSDAPSSNYASVATSSPTSAQEEEAAAAEMDTLEPAAPQFPMKHLGFTLIVFVPLLVSSIAKNKWVTCHENVTGYWGVAAGINLYIILLVGLYRWDLGVAHNKIVAGEEDPELIPFIWNNYTTILYPMIAIFAGLAASLVGIGGGMITSALFLEAGLTPEEVSASGGFITFCVAAEALSQFLIQQKIRGDYFLVFFISGLIATALGQKVMMPFIMKKGWKFLIAGALATIMGLTLLAAVSVGIYATIHTVDHGGKVGFGHFCPGGGAVANVHHNGGA